MPKTPPKPQTHAAKRRGATAACWDAVVRARDTIKPAQDIAVEMEPLHDQHYPKFVRQGIAKYLERQVQGIVSNAWATHINAFYCRTMWRRCQHVTLAGGDAELAELVSKASHSADAAEDNLERARNCQTRWHKVSKAGKLTRSEEPTS